MSKNTRHRMAATALVAAFTAAFTVGCAKTEAPASAPVKEVSRKAVPPKKLDPGKPNSGFLKDYSILKPAPELDEDVVTYVNTDAQKGIRRYIGIVVDPVQVYLASDADISKLPVRGAEALAAYFERSLKTAIGDAFPIVEQPGPLVLRLRGAIVGIDTGSDAASASKDDPSEPLERPVVISKAIVELELVDSETGEVVAAAVDKAELAAGAEVGAAHFSRVERFRAAQDALDEWARRVRRFLDLSYRLSDADAKRAIDSYRPYGDDTK